MVRTLAAALSLSLVLHSAVVSAQPSEAERAEARKLAGEAMDLFAASDFKAALPKFQRADELVPAPTLKLRIARCLNQLDRLREAADVYREVIAYEIKPGDKAVYREARQEAIPELEALLPQIPSVLVVVTGPGAGDAALSIDGTPLPREFLDEKQPLDPGFYVFRAEAGDRAVSRELSLERGQAARVELVLPAATGPAPAPADTGAEGPSSDAMWIGGWVALGVGAVGLGVGIGVGAAVLSEESDLEARCPNRRCPPEAHDDAEAFDTLRIASTAGFVVGGVGTALGATLLVLAATRAPAPEAARVTPWLSPFGGGVRVDF